MFKLFRLFLIFSFNIAIAGLGQSVVHEHDKYKIKFVRFLLGKVNNPTPGQDSSPKLIPENVSKHRGLFNCSDIEKNKLYKFNSINGKTPSYFLFTNVKVGTITAEVNHGGEGNEEEPLLGPKLGRGSITADEDELDEEKFNRIFTEINTRYDHFSTVKSILKKRYLQTPKGTKLSQISKDNILELNRKAGAYSVVDSELEFRQAIMDNTDREAVFQDSYSFIEYDKEFYNLFACEEFKNTMQYFNVVLWGYHLNKGLPSYTPFFIFSTETDKTHPENSLFITDKDDFVLKFKYWFKYIDFFEFTTILFIDQWASITGSGASFEAADLSLKTNPILRYKESHYDYEKNQFLTYVIKNYNNHEIHLKQNVTLRGNDLSGSINTSIHNKGTSANASVEDKIEQVSDTISKFSVKQENHKLISVSYSPHHTQVSLECRDFQMNVLYLFKKERGKGKNYFLFTPVLYVNPRQISPTYNFSTYKKLQYRKFNNDFGTNKYHESALDSNTFMTQIIEEDGVYHTIDDKYFQVYKKRRTLLILKESPEELLNNKIYKDNVYNILFSNYRQDTEHIGTLNIEKLMESGIDPIQNFNIGDKDYFNTVLKRARDVSEIFRDSIIGLDIFYYTYSFIRYDGINYNLVACDELDKENNQELILWGYKIINNLFEYKPFYVILTPLETDVYRLSLTDKLTYSDNNHEGIFKSKVPVSLN